MIPCYAHRSNQVSMPNIEWWSAIESRILVVGPAYVLRRTTYDVYIIYLFIYLFVLSILFWMITIEENWKGSA